MEYLAHIQGCKCQEGSRGSFSGHHRDNWSVDYYWNHIGEIYSDIKQGDNESIDKLDQCIKNLVEKCQYTEAEKLVHRTELLFHATKSLRRSRSESSQRKRWEDVTYTALLQYAKEHEMTVKDFNHHKSNRGITQLMTSKHDQNVSNVERKAVEMEAQMEQAVCT